MTERADVLVIGGGPAGAAAAARLAASGLRVVLCERQAAPRPQVCGEYVSAAAAAELDQLGLAPSGLDAPPAQPRPDLGVRARRSRFELPAAGHGLSRARLDRSLLAQASRGGADVRTGTAVRMVARDRRRVERGSGRRRPDREPGGRSRHRQARPARASPALARHPANDRLQDALPAACRSVGSARRCGRAVPLRWRLRRAATDRNRRCQSLLRHRRRTPARRERRLDRRPCAPAKGCADARGPAARRAPALAAAGEHRARPLWLSLRRPRRRRRAVSGRGPGGGDSLVHRRRASRSPCAAPAWRRPPCSRAMARSAMPPRCDATFGARSAGAGCSRRRSGIARCAPSASASRPCRAYPRSSRACAAWILLP